MGTQACCSCSLVVAATPCLLVLEAQKVSCSLVVAVRQQPLALEELMVSCSLAGVMPCLLELAVLME